MVGDTCGCSVAEPLINGWSRPSRATYVGLCCATEEEEEVAWLL